MNSVILNTEIQDFINSHLTSNITALLLKGIPFKHVNQKIIVEQIEAKKRCEYKLPTWFTTEKIYYPNKLNIEQASSEITAKYKAGLVSGQSLIDLTGGFGVDTHYFAKHVDTVTHCELDTHLSQIVAHNTTILRTKNITCLNDNGISILKQLDQSFDWIYIDPSRRDYTMRKVFLLSDCTPNITTYLDLFFKYTTHILLKTSPLLDIKATCETLQYAKTLHIIAVNNDVKELIWELERNFKGNLNIITKNITKTETQSFDFVYHNESNADVSYSPALTFLYEPNAAILKAGAFNSISHSLKLHKLHKHAHLYTSEHLIEFPGRRFKIDTVIPFNKKALSKTGITKANVTTRHFPLSVSEIRKKFNLKDGGEQYLFFTTHTNDEKIILVCSKTSN